MRKSRLSQDLYGREYLRGMAKFRRGHQKTRGTGVRTVLLFVALVMLVMAIYFGYRMITETRSNGVVIQPHADHSPYLPAASGGQVVHHAHYSLSYLEAYEQAQWVAYELTREELNSTKVERTDWFYADYDVSTRSAFHRDYSGSGYTRGHLAPAADMAFDSVAMRESFFMSNISPQVRAFNNGIWRELEEQTRDWARDDGRLYVVTGPVLHKGLRERIGKNRVAVPEYFYKVLVDPDDPEIKGIGFLIPNAMSDEPLLRFVVPIDSIEVLTGIDFFPQLAVPIDEATINERLWPVAGWRYRKRVDDWNHQ
jgi:endonuclease G